MFRRLSLRALYDNHDETGLKTRLVHTVLLNTCPVILFFLAFWAFREFVWQQVPLTVNWK